MYTNRRRERSIDNGVIYPFLNLIVNITFHLNIVEYIKKISDMFTKIYFKNHSQQVKWIKIRRNRNIAIDIFVVAKFLFVVIVFLSEYKDFWVQIVVYYLLISNVFTYFYYHLWSKDALLENHLTVHRVRRRFINLFLSIGFMMLCYVYLYYYLTPDHFVISTAKESNEYLVFIINSLAKSFGIDYESIKAVDDIGTLLELSQVINTFIFVTIILAKSLPKADRE